MEIVLDTRRVGVSARRGPFEQAKGIDATGPWSLDPAGATLRLRRNEAFSIQAEAWILRREYLSAKFDATCVEDPNQPGRLAVRARAHAPDAGDPVLTFDQETAALLSADLPLQTGRRTVREYETWSAPNAAGVRWPLAWTGLSDDGVRVRIEVTSTVEGLHCRRGDGRADAAIELSGDVCFDMHSPTRTSWPSSRRVRVPMRMLGGLVALPARIGARELWALFDSGAHAAVVGRDGPVASTFRPFGNEMSGMAATQAVPFDVGTLDSIGIGELVLSHNVAQRLSFPEFFRELGTKSPELILGWPLFAMAAIRIDYVRSEVTLAADAAGLLSPTATAVPLRVAEGFGPLAELDVEGERGWFLVDTGSDGVVSLSKAWSDQHGFPGARPTSQKRARFGFGSQETTATVFRLGRATLGPIRMVGRNAVIHDPLGDGDTAGIVGEGALSRCAAVIFDVPQRSLWFEPPCE